MRAASARAIARVTTISWVPDSPVAPGSSPPWPASTAMMMLCAPWGACAARTLRSGFGTVAGVSVGVGAGAGAVAAVTAAVAADVSIAIAVAAVAALAAVAAFVKAAVAAAAAGVFAGVVGAMADNARRPPSGAA